MVGYAESRATLQKQIAHRRELGYELDCATESNSPLSKFRATLTGSTGLMMMSQERAGCSARWSMGILCSDLQVNNAFKSRAALYFGRASHAGRIVEE